MKKPIPCYAYKDRELVGHYESLLEAHLATGDNQQSIRWVIDGKRQMTRKGYSYTTEPLTEEQIKKLPIKEKKEKEYKPRFNSQCKEIIGNLELEVPCSDHQIFFIERSAQGRKNQLRQFIHSHMRERWMTVPQKVYLMESKFVDTLLDSL
jgi:hypothetical protein